MTRLVEQAVVDRRLRFDQKERLVFPTEFVHVYDGWITAVNFANEGYGIVPIINHPEGINVFQVMEFVFRYPQFRSRRFGSFMSMHRWENPILGPIVRGIVSETGIETYPVVNKSTVDKGKAKGRKENDGYTNGFNGMMSILEDAGFFGLVPEGKTGNLDEVVKEMSKGGEVPDTMGLFVASTDKRKFNRYAVLFLGITKPEGFQLNPFKRRVLVGKTLTKDEIKEAVNQRYPDSKSKYKDIGRFCLEELHELIHNH